MMNDFQLDAYLARIGVRASPLPDAPTLAALHAAHVNAIPFESFDPLLRRAVKLDLPSLHSKLVHSRRGGYCFEQNGIFKAALDRIGFRTTGLGGRVRWMSPPDSQLGPRTHMLIKVDLPDGPYLADVGFGVCVLDEPLRLQPDLEQRTNMGTYRLKEEDGMFWLSAKQPAGWRTMYVFTLEAQIQADYEIGSWFAATHPSAPFSTTLIMERVSSDKRYKLVNRRFTIEAREGQLLEERILVSPDELREVLDETFNVKPPAEADEVFGRTG